MNQTHTYLCLFFRAYNLYRLLCESMWKGLTVTTGWEGQHNVDNRWAFIDDHSGYVETKDSSFSSPDVSGGESRTFKERIFIYLNPHKSYEWMVKNGQNTAGLLWYTQIIPNFGWIPLSKFGPLNTCVRRYQLCQCLGNLSSGCIFHQPPAARKYGCVGRIPPKKMDLFLFLQLVSL